MTEGVVNDYKRYFLSWYCSYIVYIFRIAEDIDRSVVNIHVNIYQTMTAVKVYK